MARALHLLALLPGPPRGAHAHPALAAAVLAAARLAHGLGAIWAPLERVAHANSRVAAAPARASVGALRRRSRCRSGEQLHDAPRPLRRLCWRWRRWCERDGAAGARESGVARAHSRLAYAMPRAVPWARVLLAGLTRPALLTDAQKAKRALPPARARASVGVSGACVLPGFHHGARAADWDGGDSRRHQPEEECAHRSLHRLPKRRPLCCCTRRCCGTGTELRMELGLTAQCAA